MGIQNKLLKGLYLLVITGITTTFLFTSSCKRNDDNDPSIPPGTGDNSLEIVFRAKANSKDFNLGDTFTLASENFKYNFEIFKFYVSNVRLVRFDSTEFLLKDVDLINFRMDDKHLSFTTKVPEGEFKELKFGIGLDSITNNSNPNLFSVTHPLAGAQGTHWDMTSQYRFLLIEGSMDTVTNDSINVMNAKFAVHTGTNDLFREKTFSKYLKFIKGDNKKLYVEIDVDAFLSGINFRTDHSSHTLGDGFPLAEKVTNNFVNSLSLKEQ